MTATNTQTKVGKLVRANLEQIFRYCTEVDPSELANLLDRDYSKATFDVNYPFVATLSDAARWEHLGGNHRRFWAQTYTVHDIELQATKEWRATSLPLVVAYLLDKGLTPIGVTDSELTDAHEALASGPASARFRKTPIGNPQNYLGRNILGSLPGEAFSQKDWIEVKHSFNFCCAYCGERGPLEMDHAVAINIDSLGEHQLGNLIPACPPCNGQKSKSRYDAFLRETQPSDCNERIARVESHMRAHGYVPLDERLDAKRLDEVRTAIYAARLAVADAADEAIASITQLLDRA